MYCGFSKIVMRYVKCAVALSIASTLVGLWSIYQYQYRDPVSSDERYLKNNIPVSMGTLPWGFEAFRYYYLNMAEVSLVIGSVGGWQGAGILTICRRDTKIEWEPGEEAKCAKHINGKIHGLFLMYRVIFIGLAILLHWNDQRRRQDRNRDRHMIRNMVRTFAEHNKLLLEEGSSVVRRRQSTGGKIPRRSERLKSKYSSESESSNSNLSELSS